MTEQSLTRTKLERSLEVKSLGDLVRVKQQSTVWMLLDCSGSMGAFMRNGKTRIDGLREVVRDVQSKRTDTRLIVFGPGWEPKQVNDVPRSPGGGTPLTEAITYAKSLNAGRLLVVSDGLPNSPNTAMEAARQFGGRIDVVFVGDPGERGEAFLLELASITGGTGFDGDLSEPKQLARGIIGLLETGDKE